MTPIGIHRLSKVPPWTLRKLHESGLSPEEIAALTPEEAFRRALEWEGISGYANQFWQDVKALLALAP